MKIKKGSLLLLFICAFSLLWFGGIILGAHLLGEYIKDTYGNPLWQVMASFALLPAWPLGPCIALRMTLWIPDEQKSTSVLECEALVDGLGSNPVPVRISAKRLPKVGEKFAALCQWPRLTAKGLRPARSFKWAAVELVDNFVRVTPR